MKKKLLVLLMCGCMVFTACGDKNETENEKETETEQEQKQEQEQEDTGKAGAEAGGLMNAISGIVGNGEDSKTDESSSGVDSEGAYWAPQGSVELGQYLGIEVDKIEVEVTDAEVQAEIDYFLEYQSEYREITDRTVIQAGDTVNLDYKLVVDGAEVDSYEDYNVEIGSGDFIEIESRLIGLTVGTEQELVTAIEDEYNYPDYVGKEGTWTLTLNAIQEKVTPDLTDELVAANTDYATVEEYREGTYNELYASKEDAAENKQISAIFDQIIENSVFTGLSDADVQSYVDALVSSYEEYATTYGLDMESFVSIFLGVSYDEFLEMAKEDGEYAVRQNLILKAVQEAEKTELTEQEYVDGLAAYAADYGYDSPEEFEQAAGEEEVRTSLLREKVLNLIIDSAVIK